MQISRSRPLKIIFWTVVTILLLTSLILPEWIRQARKNDRAGAVLQEGIATVVTRVEPGASDMGNPTVPQVMVRFHGALYPAKEVADFEELKEGKPARILYSVGKSGRIYVDLVKPILPARRPTTNVSHE